MLYILFFLAFCALGFELPQFPAGSPWTTDISGSEVNPNSYNITNWVRWQGGWGGHRDLFQIDTSIVVLTANCSTPRVPLFQKPGYDYDCDNVTEIPTPNEGALEGEFHWNSTCFGDCHLLIHDLDSGLLYDSWDTNVTLDVNGRVTDVDSACIVVWNTSHLYPSSGRGDGCSSADAAGFPISSLLFTADEIKNGAINHAIRFILPNNRIRKEYYVHPASHYGGPNSSSVDAVVYGSRWRLKADFDMASFSSEAQVVLKALQKYGMFLADGGNIALTAMSDAYNSISWVESGLGTLDLKGVYPQHFDVVNGFGSDLQGPFTHRPSCVKNHIPMNMSCCCGPNSETTRAAKDGNFARANLVITIMSWLFLVWIM